MSTTNLTTLQDKVLRLVLAAEATVKAGTLEKSLDASRPTLNRTLSDLVSAGLLIRRGGGRSTCYVATDTAKAMFDTGPTGLDQTPSPNQLTWSQATL